MRQALCNVLGSQPRPMVRPHRGERCAGIVCKGEARTSGRRGNRGTPRVWPGARVARQMVLLVHGHNTATAAAAAAAARNGSNRCDGRGVEGVDGEKGRPLEDQIERGF